MVVVASNDNDRLKLPYQAFRSVYLCRGLTRFLTIAEVADVEDGVVITSLTVRQFFMKRAKEAIIIAPRIRLDVGFLELKYAL